MYCNEILQTLDMSNIVGHRNMWNHTTVQVQEQERRRFVSRNLLDTETSREIVLVGVS